VSRAPEHHHASSSFIPDGVEHASFDPTPPDGAPTPLRRWWGHPFRESLSMRELARLFADPIFRGVGVPHGHGTPVLLIPGFLAGDTSLAVLREWLGRIGYDARPSGIVANVDCSNRALDRLDYRLKELQAESGAKVAVIGHSRGGHLAKALAHRHPERVACVVSMGAGLDTPFDISIPTKFAVAAVRAVHQRGNAKARAAGCFTDTCKCRFARDYGGEFPAHIPLTSVYTRDDGVVWWEACVVPYARNVEVSGSHVGLAFNRKSYRAVAEALATVGEPSSAEATPRDGGPASAAARRQSAASASPGRRPRSTSAT
jgi:triacylglycerol lipase